MSRRGRYLRQLEQQPLVYEHDLPFALDVDGVYTLRGPRQVGKTTLLKTLVRDLLKRRGVHPRCVMYADIGATSVETEQELQEFVAAFLDDAAQRESCDRTYVLLDEVTGMTDSGTSAWGGNSRGATRAARRKSEAKIRHESTWRPPSSCSCGTFTIGP